MATLPACTHLPASFARAPPALFSLAPVVSPLLALSPRHSFRPIKTYVGAGQRYRRPPLPFHQRAAPSANVDGRRKKATRRDNSAHPLDPNDDGDDGFAACGFMVSCRSARPPPLTTGTLRPVIRHSHFRSRPPPLPSRCLVFHLVHSTGPLTGACSPVCPARLRACAPARPPPALPLSPLFPFPTIIIYPHWPRPPSPLLPILVILVRRLLDPFPLAGHPSPPPIPPPWSIEPDRSTPRTTRRNSSTQSGGPICLTGKDKETITSSTRRQLQESAPTHNL